jgi:anti-sigma B factor antagonist
MEMKQEKIGNVLVIGLQGRLDATNSAIAEKQLIALVKGGETRLVFDFSELTYISSLGLRVLIVAAKLVKEADGKFALGALRDPIFEIFKIAGFHSIFPIYPTCDAAVAYCAS